MCVLSDLGICLTPLGYSSSSTITVDQTEPQGCPQSQMLGPKP